MDLEDLVAIDGHRRGEQDPDGRLRAAAAPSPGEPHDPTVPGQDAIGAPGRDG